MRKLYSLLIALTLVLAAPCAALAIETWTYFSLVGDAVGLPVHVITYMTVALVLVVLGLIVGGRYRAKLRAYEAWKALPLDQRGDSPIDPEPKFSLANFFEGGIQIVLGLMEEIIGKDSKKYLPLIGSLMFIILFSNVP